jgi:hypothetical protein
VTIEPIDLPLYAVEHTILPEVRRPDACLS